VSSSYNTIRDSNPVSSYFCRPDRRGCHVTTIEIDNPREPIVGRWWWVLLVTGILWILLGLFVLNADYSSAVLIGLMVAIWLLFAAVAEFVEAGVAEGWRWLHIAIGVFFIIGGIMALLSPFQTFTILAALIGIFLVLKGTVDFVIALMLRHEADLWWLSLIVGVIEILLGIWAMGYPGRSAALLIVWIGVGAIVRGIAEIVMSFHIRKDPEVVVAV
jgi:uncharacterized membrane protein HdeD (DUF308 family)